MCPQGPQVGGWKCLAWHKNRVSSEQQLQLFLMLGNGGKKALMTEMSSPAAACATQGACDEIAEIWGFLLMLSPFSKNLGAERAQLGSYRCGDGIYMGNVNLVGCAPVEGLCAESSRSRAECRWQQLCIQRYRCLLFAFPAHFPQLCKVQLLVLPWMSSAAAVQFPS